MNKKEEKNTKETNPTVEGPNETENKEEVKQKIEQKQTEEKQNEIKKETKQQTQKTNKEKSQKKKRMWIVAFFALLTAIVAYVLLRGTYLETLEIGEIYINSFWQNVRYMVVTLIINFGVIYLLVYMTNLKIKKGLKVFFDQEHKEMPKLLNKSIAFIAAVLISALTSGMIKEKAVLCINAAQFGVNDPIFGIDIGYFVFQKTFIQLVLMYAMVAVVVLAIYTVIYYIITFNMFFDGVDRKTLKNSKLITQLTNSVMVLAVLLAGYIFFQSQDIGTERFLTLNDGETSYSLYGAGLADVTIKLWGYRLLCLVLIFCVYKGIKAFKEGKTRKLVISIAAIPCYLVGLFLVLVVFKAIWISPNELDKEKDYIAQNIRSTKEAYGVNIEEVSLSEAETITSEVINDTEEVVGNIAIVSEDIVLKELNNGQTAKGYYTYRSTSIAKYKINGEDTLVYVSPREIVSSSGTYNNKTYEYTHGYGAIITSATDTKDTGNLNHIQRGFNEQNEAITITQPRIYFGIETNDTVVTNCKDKNEFDYPVLDSQGAENAENNYDGEAGLTLNFIDRMILAIKEGDLKLAFSGDITDESKILTNRNIIERAKVVMPYLKYDEDPYLVVTEEGKLVWVLDAYTTSNSYPYSQKTTLQETATNKIELNYIRNSVKVLIDAYDGTTTFYITDRSDPIAMAYRNAYPDLFADLEESIPADIAQHFVYPEYLYNIQADIIARYHNIQPDVLYRGDDIWEIATHNTGRVLTKTGTDMEPYYTMVKTVDEEDAQLGLVLPYTPYNRQNLISYLVGTYDNSGNGKLTIYKYQADTNILGPMQLDTQIEQDETIAKEIESLNVSGTKITKNMIIVPINNTLLYVEPIYQQYINEADALPVLKKVVVASGNKVAIGDNLEQALARLVSQYAVDIEVENTDSIEDLIDTLIKANGNLDTSLSSNDWEMIGKDVQKLQDLIDKLETLVEEERQNRNEIANQTNETIVNETTNTENNVIVNEMP